MNHLLWPTGLLAVVLFWIGSGVETKLVSRPQRVAFIVIATVVALPGLLFAAYYTKLLGEPLIGRFTSTLADLKSNLSVHRLLSRHPVTPALGDVQVSSLLPS